MTDLRVGLGYDIHPLRVGRALVLGGVPVPAPMGLLGHSDGDVLTHALMDALLGAAGLGDIGAHFPSTDPTYKDACSLDLLRQVVAMLARAGWEPLQAVVVVVAERPRLAPHIPQMRAALAAALAVPIEAVGIQATTNEGLGALGRGEGIAAWATALIRRKAASRYPPGAGGEEQ